MLILGKAATCAAIHRVDAVSAVRLLPNRAFTSEAAFYANEPSQHIRYLSR